MTFDNVEAIFKNPVIISTSDYRINEVTYDIKELFK